MRSVFIALSAFAATAFAQTSFANCCTVDPSTLQLTRRNEICRAQFNTCPTLCPNGQTANNTCDQATLTYNCTCLTGSPGNLSDYQQSLPAQECLEWVGQCVAANPDNSQGQAFCRSFVCGNKTAPLLSAVTSSAASASTGASSTASGSGTASTNSAASISASRSAAAAATMAVHFGQQYGTAALGLAGAALFGLAL